MRHNILLVDDDLALRISMKNFLEEEGFFVKAVSGGDEAIAHIRQGTLPFSLALVDYHMPDLSGPEVIKTIREIDSKLTLVGFSGDDSDLAHNNSLDSGAMMFIAKDVSNNKLLGILHRICREVERREKKYAALPGSDRKSLIESVGMVGVSEHLAKVAGFICKMAPSIDTVLIRGANGTGKEKVAQALHELSPRRLGPFIAVNCAAIAKDLIESELFGHEKGAFSGASQANQGKFQAANGGTLFLDEIGDMPLAAQVALLRVLQSKEVIPVGSSQVKKINVRVVAATNAPLEDRITQGLFREDLYHRLNVLPINLVALDDRPEDIAPLVLSFLDKENRKRGLQKTITESCIRELEKRRWPGNIRALGNAVSRMHLLTEETLITEESLKFIKTDESDVSPPSGTSSDLELLRVRHTDEEIALVARTLDAAESLSAAAAKLGVTRSTLRSRLRALKIKNPFQESEPS
jgi:DNA-binding NtrC family response regulator